MAMSNSDKLTVGFDSMPAEHHAYYDPEGLVGRGKSREDAVADLLEQTDEAWATAMHERDVARRALSDEIQAKQRFARELLMHVTGKSYYDSGTKMRARWCLLCDTETPPDAERLAHKPGCLTAEAEEAAK